MRSNQTELQIITVPCGAGAGNSDTEFGPAILRQYGLQKSLEADGLASQWHEIPVIKATRTRFDIVFKTISKLVLAVENVAAQRNPFLVLGGDHSIAAGTWTGLSNIYGGGSFGLIWIDAHLDAHTPETTPSGNWHGMPVAHLLGYGLDKIKNLSRRGPALRPEFLSYIGVRSYEPEELALLQSLGVRVFMIEEVKQRGFAAVWQEALAIARRAPAGFGISFDVDSIDPVEAPAVGTPVLNGLRASELLSVLAGVSSEEGFLGIEIVEFNPCEDRNHQTLNVLLQLIPAWFKPKSEGVKTRYPSSPYPAQSVLDAAL